MSKYSLIEWKAYCIIGVIWFIFCLLLVYKDINYKSDVNNIKYKMIQLQEESEFFYYNQSVA